MTKLEYTTTRRFLFELVGTISLDRNYREVINLLFVLAELYLNILKTEKYYCSFGTKNSRRASFQEVKGYFTRARYMNHPVCTIFEQEFFLADKVALSSKHFDKLASTLARD